MGTVDLATWSALLWLASLSVTALAWAGGRLLERAPAPARHVLWLATLGVLALQPILSAVGPQWRVGGPVARALSAAPVPHGLPDQLEAGAPVERRPIARLDAAAEAPSRSRLSRLSRFLGGVYAAGVLVGLVSLLAGVLRLRAICRRASRDLGVRLGPLAAAAGPAAEVRLSQEIAVPLTCGLVRPIVLLPVAAATWPPRRVADALTHELAHVARRDVPVQLFARLVSILYWCQPLVAWIERQLRLEAERVCDGRVVAAGTSAPDYAQQLIDLARGARRSRELAAAAGMSAQSDLQARVASLLAPPARPARPLPVALLVLLLLGLGGASATVRSGARPVGERSFAASAETLPGLLEAAGRGDLQEVRRRLAGGDDPDRAVPSRGTPLIRAATWGHLQVVEELLAAGADPNRAEGGGGRPEGLQRTPLTAAASGGSLAVTRALLTAGAEVEAAPEGDGTALMEAALNGHSEIVEILLAHGADADRRLEGDGSPLIAAVRGGSEAIVHRLLVAGADPAAGVPGDGNPLIAAVERGDRRLVELLLQAGADPHAYVPGDETAVTRALERGRFDLVDLLLGR